MRNSMKKIPAVIVSHSVFMDKSDVFGPGHAVSQFLESKKISHTYLKHSLYDSQKSRVIQTIKSKRRGKMRHEQSFFGPPPLRPITHLIQGVLTYRYLKSNPVHVCIAVNPLNAIAALLAKRHGYVSKVILYTADYADQRFNNLLLNRIYHTIDHVAIKGADRVWNTSTRIQKKRAEQGIEEVRNRFVPNAPHVALLKKKRDQRKIPTSMVLMANFTPSINFKLILKVCAQLKKKHPRIKLYFIGGGVMEDEVKSLASKMGLKKNVTFHGFQDHEKALEIAAACKISLAIYGTSSAWTEYGDSLKARESLGLGLPVIITNNVSTSDDISRQNAGFSIEMKPKKLFTAIDSLFTKPKLYKQMQANSIKLADMYDLSRIMNTELYIPFLKQI